MTELEGANGCFKKLLDFKVFIPEFVKGRQTGISKWLKEQHPEIGHYFDIWLNQLTRKSASREKGAKVCHINNTRFPKPDNSIIDVLNKSHCQQTWKAC